MPDKLAALARAIAWELIQLGYRPAGEPGFAQRENDENRELRPVADEVLQAMKDILSGSDP